MAVVAYEAIVENGQIRLAAPVQIPNHTRVFVVVPEGATAPSAGIWSPRLVHAEDAQAFRMEVRPETPDAAV